ncbi:hypothetical protein CEP88_05325 [Roseobacter denitrificans]|uniref:Uncharacterized protein n=1 Tax=Roseobacter denitrificans (strain ATCC 33942 / OCh 114) TaxID=375451 RepID=Q164F7_ROSDO|nr:hypothetical protein [Roseobacter denitrificans]ABG32636.1 conserved hypothetical protein [Roseobacter denitrificans OCh 114]AVL52073.1 hypothetical protein CEP88_05325 [Roseobacter denitrificans]SFF93069.1 hypothetical protein SAMN05443635_10457 [Roseobacter denitrificans OCh 114]
MFRFAFTLAFLALPAAADITYPSGKTVDCYCTDRGGSRIELGETICMQVDGRMFMAQCQMSLNVPMWREVEQGCLSSSLEGGDQPLQSVAIDAEI